MSTTEPPEGPKTVRPETNVRHLSVEHPPPLVGDLLDSLDSLEAHLERTATPWQPVINALTVILMIVALTGLVVAPALAIAAWQAVL